jgi:hypothetical protein
MVGEERERVEDGQVAAEGGVQPEPTGEPDATVSDQGEGAAVADAAVDAATVARAAREARRAAKAERKAARVASKRAAKAAKRAAKAERKAVARAERKAAKAARAAEKSVRKAAKNATKVARAEVEAAVRSERKAIRAAAKAQRKAVKAELRATEETRRADHAAMAEAAAVSGLAEVADAPVATTAAEAQAAAAPGTIDEDAASEESSTPATSREPEATEEPEEPEATEEPEEPEATEEPEEPEATEEPEEPAASDEVTSAAAEPVPESDAEPIRPTTTAMLAEVADLVRQAAEPPAERIIERIRQPEPPPEVEPPDLAPDAIIAATMDVGANSAHLLVAAVGGHQVQPLLDESVFLGLGDRVAESGYLGPALRGTVADALTAYADTARRLGAQEVLVVGTEPLRRAADAATLIQVVERTTGVAVHVLSHDEEAMLTLLGVTMGRPIRERQLVVDIGGGSSELVLAGRRGVERALGLRLGCATLTRDHARSDPPTLREIEAMRETARAALAEEPDLEATEMVAVGGTASNLLKLMPSTSLDRVLTRRRIAVTLAMLTVQNSTEAAERHLIRPERARILPAGAVIMDAVLERYRIGRVRVAEEGIREGVVLAAAAAGAGWRDRLSDLVRGWPGD